MIEKIFSHAQQKGYFHYQGDSYQYVLKATGNIGEGLIEVVEVAPRYENHDLPVIIKSTAPVKIITPEEAKELSVMLALAK